MHTASFTFVFLAIFSACTLAAPVPADATSGAAGMAPGGSVSDEPSVVSLFSGNAGNGGEANSGAALAKDSTTNNSPGSSNVLAGSGSRPLGSGRFGHDTGLLDILGGISGERTAESETDNTIF
ncbi:hypothetical protein C8F04DRAFT_1390459 [Mycena alexandri]|uniref:Secreted protein n=1 Tax=Mycena alexandri TaxID=1745969 RepID=A0AAD6TB90_9AGAR|nr:hypothetical protein C8F04DRAFT_1390459 [Mycena alexandri]